MSMVGSSGQDNAHKMVSQLNGIYAEIIDSNIYYVGLCSKYLHNWHNGMIITK